MTDPQVLARSEQFYVGIRRTVTMDTIGSIADRVPVLIGWLRERGIAPAGAPFLRYRVIDMARQLDVEAGVPVGEAIDGGDDVTPGSLPAGRYVTATHIGPYDGLIDATSALLTWADDRGLVFGVRDSADGDVWDCRLEIFNTNPLEEPDPARQETVLAFKLAD